MKIKREISSIYTFITIRISTQRENDRILVTS
jgi:hypothetical protein